MVNAYQCFCTLMQDTKNTCALYDYLHQVVKPPYDYNDLLRWQWAQSVSALDKLIHDIVRIGMRESFSGNRPITDKFSNFAINFSTYQQLQQNQLSAPLVFEQYVTAKNKTLSFQEPDKISDGLSYIWAEPHKWQAIATQMGKAENAVRTELKNISIRRNQIVHEGDYITSNTSRQSIEKADVDEVSDFIELLGTAIYTLVR